MLNVCWQGIWRQIVVKINALLSRWNVEYMLPRYMKTVWCQDTCRIFVGKIQRGFIIKIHVDYLLSRYMETVCCHDTCWIFVGKIHEESCCQDTCWQFEESLLSRYMCKIQEVSLLSRYLLNVVKVHEDCLFSWNMLNVSWQLTWRELPSRYMLNVCCQDTCWMLSRYMKTVCCHNICLMFLGKLHEESCCQDICWMFVVKVYKKICCLDTW